MTKRYLKDWAYSKIIDYQLTSKAFGSMALSERRSCARRLEVSPAGSVGASAYGRGVHRTPAPLRIVVDKQNLFTGVMKSNFEIQCRS